MIFKGNDLINLIDVGTDWNHSNLKGHLEDELECLLRCEIHNQITGEYPDCLESICTKAKRAILHFGKFREKEEDHEAVIYCQGHSLTGFIG